MLRFAVVGVGRMGSVHARNLYNKKVKGARLVAICDIDQSAIDKFMSRRSGVNTYIDFRDMIAKENLDGLIVATQHYVHKDVAEYAIEHGINTLVEKPLCVTTKAVKQLLEVDQKSGLKNVIMFNQRTNPLYIRAKRLVESGKIGDIQRINFIITNWYRSQAYYDQGGWRASLSGEGGGTLINQCVHQLDLLQWICGMPVAIESHMFTKNRNISTENDVVALMEYDNNVYCSFSASTHELRGTNRLEIAGTKGRIVIDGLRMKVYTFRKSEIEVNATTKNGYGVVSRRTERRQHILGFALGSILGQQVNIIRNFADCINGKADRISPMRDGLNAVELINSIYLSDWLGKKVSLPIDDELYEKVLMDKIKEESGEL